MICVSELRRSDIGLTMVVCRDALGPIEGKLVDWDQIFLYLRKADGSVFHASPDDVRFK